MDPSVASRSYAMTGANNLPLTDDYHVNMSSGAQ